MTKTEQRRIGSRLRTLRADRKAWLTGKHLQWGAPWCSGPLSPYHQAPLSEGCAAVAWCRDRAAEVTEAIGRLESLLAPVVQGALW